MAGQGDREDNGAEDHRNVADMASCLDIKQDEEGPARQFDRMQKDQRRERHRNRSKKRPRCSRRANRQRWRCGGRSANWFFEQGGWERQRRRGGRGNATRH